MISRDENNAPNRNGTLAGAGAREFVRIILMAISVIAILLEDVCHKGKKRGR